MSLSQPRQERGPPQGPSKLFSATGPKQACSGPGFHIWHPRWAGEGDSAGGLAPGPVPTQPLPCAGRPSPCSPPHSKQRPESWPHPSSPSQPGPAVLPALPSTCSSPHCCLPSSTHLCSLLQDESSSGGWGEAAGWASAGLRKPGRREVHRGGEQAQCQAWQGSGLGARSIVAADQDPAPPPRCFLSHSPERGGEAEPASQEVQEGTGLQEAAAWHGAWAGRGKAGVSPVSTRGFPHPCPAIVCCSVTHLWGPGSHPSQLPLPATQPLCQRVGGREAARAPCTPGGLGHRRRHRPGRNPWAVPVEGAC